MNQLYLKDFVAWADEQGMLLEQERWDELDLINLIEEVKDLGRRERDAIESQLVRLMMHLLKWQFQPELRTRSWEISIKGSRHEIERLIEKYPVLKNQIQDENRYYSCYLRAIKYAVDETRLSERVFPAEPPLLQTVMDPEYWPITKD